jgi:hypothetical protein
MTGKFSPALAVYASFSLLLAGKFLIKVLIWAADVSLHYPHPSLRATLSHPMGEGKCFIGCQPGVVLLRLRYAPAQQDNPGLISVAPSAQAKACTQLRRSTRSRLYFKVVKELVSRIDWK